MATCSEHRSPLQRSGTARGARALDALRPSSVEIIDKDAEDWIVWASRLSSRIRFHDEENQPSGTFEPLFSSDIAAHLAAITTHPPDTLPVFFREQLTQLLESDNSSQPDVLRSAYTSLYDVLFSYLRIVDGQYRLAMRERDVLLQRTDAEDDAALRAPIEEFCTQLGSHISQRLLRVAGSTAAYALDAEAKGLLIEQAAPSLTLFHKPLSTRAEVIEAGLSEIWWQGAASWSAWYASVAPSDTIHLPVGTVAEHIQHAARHHFFTGLLDDVVASCAFIMTLARRSMSTLLSAWPHHQPQYALFLSWLRLMEEARGGVNELVGRHLDFYYSDVLQLRPAPATADTAFPTLELNKVVESIALPAGTAFNAGKDADGQAISFETTRETVLSRAKLSQLRSVYTTAEENGNPFPAVHVYAAPVVNSADGLGAELESELKEWHPFAPITVEAGVTSITMPDATLGFAVASRYLLLAEGKRTITVRLNVGSDPSALAALGSIEVGLTQPKGWISAVALLSEGTMSDTSKPAVVLSMQLAGDAPSITPFDGKVHGHTFGTADPVLRILFPPSDDVREQLAAISALRLEEVEIEVEAGSADGDYDSSGLRNFVAHNDAGQVNPSKPFMPWGVEPTVGNSLILGCEEIARKEGAVVQFNFSWKDLPSDADDIRYGSNIIRRGRPGSGKQQKQYYPLVDIDSLDGGSWVMVGEDRHVFDLDASDTPLPDVACAVPNTASSAFFLDTDEEFRAYSPAATKGYFRIQLKHSFGHKSYRAAHIKYLIDGAPDPAPVEPYQPILQALHISYRARTSGSPLQSAAEGSADASVSLFHVGPFGDAPMLAASTSTGARLFPEVAKLTAPVAETQGELYLGFEQLQPGMSLSLLFQLMEGSENPLREKPDEHITWWYLASNAWQQLTDEVSDGTRQLVQSGIVEIAIPKSATTTNTILPAGLLWLKLKVTEAADAVCKVIGIHVNAVEARRSSLSQIAGAAPFIAAGTIAKLRTPLAEVKGVAQPYPSFGGSAVESPEQHRLRVSERLRHRDRAITIWDYERLVLQAFPEIYKVKCLNHTRISGSADDGTLVYNEVAPGYVTVITIPQLQNRNDADPLKPYTKASVLERIAEYLTQRISCHVRLITAQPQFEEVRVECRVVLAEGYNDTVFYDKQLQDDVTAFLSPWAFGGEAVLDFGGSLHKSVLIDFIEERPYVDVITDVKLFHTPGEGAVESGDVDEVTASTARSVLVSAHASKHEFTVELQSSIPVAPEHCDE